MEELLEKTYHLAGDANYYQKRALLIALCFWIFANVLPTSLTFYEAMPFVNIYSNNSNTLVESHVRLNYTVCESRDTRFEIAESSEFSVITSFNFECNSILVGLLGSSVFAGGSIGSMMLQVVTNQFGKKTSYTIAFIMLIVSLVCVTLKMTYWIFSLFFLIQLFTIILAYGSIVNIAETCAPHKRPLYISIINTGYSISGLIFTTVYYFNFTWKFTLSVAAGFMLFFTACFYYLSVKSPRQFVSIGDYIGFYKSVRYISKVNHRWEHVKKILPDPSWCHEKTEKDSHFHEEERLKAALLEFYQPLIDVENEEEKDVIIEEEDLEKKEAQDLYEEMLKEHFYRDQVYYEENEISDFKKLMNYPSQKSNFMILNYSWFCITGIYYCISILLKYVDGNIFMNAFLLYSVELISYPVCVVLLNTLKYGRTKVLSIFYMISVAAVILIIVLNYRSQDLLYLLLLLRFGVAGANNLNFIISLEVYPTLIRLTGFGINCNMGCFSAVLFPLFLEIEIKRGLFKIVLVLLLSSLVLIQSLPETGDCILSNVIPEESGIATHKSNSFVLKKKSDFIRRKSMKSVQSTENYFLQAKPSINNQ